MVLKVLRKIGLTDNEIKVYLSLLKLGPSKTGMIIRKSGLHSSRVYECLERLQSKGLVSYSIKSNRKCFEATNPNRLLDYLEEKGKELEEQKSAVKGILPDLVSEQKASPLQEVNIYSGFKGIKSLLKNLLEELKGGGEYNVFGSKGDIKTFLGPYFKIYQKTKAKYRIKSRLIVEEDAWNKNLAKEYIGKARFITSNTSGPTDTFVYNDKVILFIWKEDPPFAVLIKNKSAAQSYKSYFELLWRGARK